MGVAHIPPLCKEQISWWVVLGTALLPGWEVGGDSRAITTGDGVKATGALEQQGPGCP